MSKKDYELIARAIREEVDNIREIYKGSRLGLSAVRRTAGRIADAMARDNAAFNRALFMKACGFEQ